MCEIRAQGTPAWMVRVERAAYGHNVGAADLEFFKDGVSSRIAIVGHYLRILVDLLC